jgi:hypothetical protein
MTFDGAKDGKHYWLTPKELYQSLDNELRKVLGPDILIDVRLVDNIALTAAGKHRVVVRTLPPASEAKMEQAKA